MVELLLALLLAVLPACESEDSTGPCYWDATTQGNGQGSSFIALP